MEERKFKWTEESMLNLLLYNSLLTIPRQILIRSVVYSAKFLKCNSYAIVAVVLRLKWSNTLPNFINNASPSSYGLLILHACFSLTTGWELEPELLIISWKIIDLNRVCALRYKNNYTTDFVYLLNHTAVQRIFFHSESPQQSREYIKKFRIFLDV